MALSSPAAHYRALVASLARDRNPDDPDLVEARRALQTQRYQDRLTEILGEAPEFTADQRQRIISLLSTAAVRLAAGGDSSDTGPVSHDVKPARASKGGIKTVEHKRPPQTGPPDERDE